MDMLALAPGVRMALKALGFQPEQIVELMTNINSNIAKVGSALEAIRLQNIEILERLRVLENGAPPIPKENEIGRTEFAEPEPVSGDGYNSN